MTKYAPSHDYEIKPFLTKSAKKCKKEHQNQVYLLLACTTPKACSIRTCSSDRRVLRFFFYLKNLKQSNWFIGNASNGESSIIRLLFSYLDTLHSF